MSDPAHPALHDRIATILRQQGLMGYLGVQLGEVSPGRVSLTLPYRRELTQQHGYFHAGATSSIADSAGGFAGLTVFPAECSVLSVEFKINLIAPAKGERLEAVGSGGIGDSLGADADRMPAGSVCAGRWRADSGGRGAADIDLRGAALEEDCEPAALSPLVQKRAVIDDTPASEPG